VTNNEHVDVYDDRDEETTLHSRGQYLQHPTSSAKDGDDEFEDDIDEEELEDDVSAEDDLTGEINISELEEDTSTNEAVFSFGL
jgi:hypothetical protein